MIETTHGTVRYEMTICDCKEVLPNETGLYLVEHRYPEGGKIKTRWRLVRYVAEVPGTKGSWQLEGYEFIGTPVRWAALPPPSHVAEVTT